MGVTVHLTPSSTNICPEFGYKKIVYPVGVIAVRSEKRQFATVDVSLVKLNQQEKLHSGVLEGKIIFGIEIEEVELLNK